MKKTQLNGVIPVKDVKKLKVKALRNKLDPNSAFKKYTILKKLPLAYMHSHLLEWFIDSTLLSFGEKEKAEKIFENLIEDLKAWDPQMPAGCIILEAVLRLRPPVETRPLRLGANIVRIPVVVTGLRGYKLGFKYLRKAFLTRSEKSIRDRIFNEIVAILENPKDSIAIQEYDKELEIAYANRMYMHYRWF